MWRGSARRYFLSGLVLGGALMGLLLGSVGALAGAILPRWLSLGVWLLAAAVIAGAELAGKRLPLPQNARAVPQEIITSGTVSGPLQFGFEMGTGVRTFMPSGVPHIAAIGLLLTGSPLIGLVAGVGFGLGRVAMTVTRGASPDPRGWDAHLFRTRRVLSSITALTALALAVALVLVR